MYDDESRSRVAAHRADRIAKLIKKKLTMYTSWKHKHQQEIKKTLCATRTRTMCFGITWCRRAALTIA